MGGVDKTFAPILGLPLVIHTIDRFELSPLVHQIVLVVARESVDRARELVRQRGYTKVTNVSAGGRSAVGGRSRGPGRSAVGRSAVGR